MSGTHDRNAQAQRLVQALIAPADEPICRATLDRLDDYVTAQLAGEPYATLLPAVAQHLDRCVDCAESYAVLYEGRLAESSLPAPALVPQPDLSFLRGSAASDVGTIARATSGLRDRAERLRDLLAGAVERTGERVRVRLSDALLELFPLPLAPAMAVRSGGSEGTLLVDVPFQQPGAGIDQLHLRVYAQPGSPQRSTVRVQLALQDREWPDLADIPISLLVDGAPREELTDAWGEAVFEDVATAAVAGLQVEVETPTNT